MKMLRRLPKLLRFIPGTAQDVRAYFLTLQYWLAGSDENIANMVRLLVDRYADGPRQALRGIAARRRRRSHYPEVGLYHPRAQGAHRRDGSSELPRNGRPAGTVGLLLMRSYVLAGNAGHYDGVIAALEARACSVIPAFASGLDSAPGDRALLPEGRPSARSTRVVSLTGFSLVGGPAYNDARAAEDDAGAARRALPRRAPGRIPDARAMEARSRAA